MATTTPTTTVPAFDAILDLEHALKVTKAVAGMIVGGGQAALRTDRERLYAALDALTPAEMAAYGAYRATRV